MNNWSKGQLLNSSVYNLIAFPLALAWVVIFATLLSVSFGLLIVGIGIVLLSISLRAASIAASVERWVLIETLDVNITSAQRLDQGCTAADWIFGPLKDTSRWRELAFLGVRVLLGPIGCFIVIVSWVFPLFAFSTVIWGWFVFGRWTLLFLAFGVLVAAAGPFLVKALANAQVASARALLGPSRHELHAQINVVQHKRDVSVEAAENERRRIERDLHDGAQARLATVAMDLGRAKRKLDQGDPSNELAQIIGAAHEDAKAAIVELRDLARGIHPAVLTDRGLDAALSNVAARCVVPVHLDVQMSTRPAPHIESAAYFAVSELLTNITKHSKATNAWVTVRSDQSNLRIDVSDDGLGGVDANLGTGINGLQDRISSIDGAFSMSSQLGSGTSALIEIPLTEVAS